MFVHYNLRLLSHKTKEYKEGETKRWDVNEMLAVLDAFASHLSIEDFDANTIIATFNPIGLCFVPESTKAEKLGGQD